MSPRINTAVTGRFVDENGDKNSAAGETVAFNISITNDGKVGLAYILLKFSAVTRLPQ